MATSGYAAGFESAIFWLLAGNYPAGIAGSALAAGATSGAYVANDVIQANIQAAAPQTVNIQGGDREVTSFLFGSPKLNPFTITSSLLDPEFVALVSDSAVDTTTNTAYELFSTNAYNATPVLMGMALMQRFQPKTTGSTGNDKYHIVIIPKAQVRLSGGGLNYRAGSNVTLNVTPTFGEYSHLGTAFGDLGMSLQENRTDHFQMISDYKIHMVTTKGHSTPVTAWTLPYLPKSSVVTSGASQNWFTDNGAITALNTVNVSTGAVAYTTGLGAGDYGVHMYTTSFDPS